MNENKNIKAMLAELREEYPIDYETENIRVEVVDKNNNYDDDADFDESKLWEVRIFYRDKLFTLRRKYTDLFEISDDNYLDIHDLDDLGKIINIIGKHLKRISYKWDWEVYAMNIIMNINIELMLEELKKEFPKNVYQELDLRIYDNDGNGYFTDDEFQEKIFSNMFINYEMNAVEISRDKYSLFDINTDILIEQEDLAVIGKAISIVVKHLSKIEFEESN